MLIDVVMMMRSMVMLLPAAAPAQERQCGTALVSSITVLTSVVQERRGSRVLTSAGQRQHLLHRRRSTCLEHLYASCWHGGNHERSYPSSVCLWPTAGCARPGAVARYVEIFVNVTKYLFM